MLNIIIDFIQVIQNHFFSSNILFHQKISYIVEVKWQTVLHVDFSGSGCTPGTWKVLSSQIERQFFFHSERTRGKGKSLLDRKRVQLTTSHTAGTMNSTQNCVRNLWFKFKVMVIFIIYSMFHLINSANPEISHTKSTGPSHHAQKNKQTKKNVSPLMTHYLK